MIPAMIAINTFWILSNASVFTGSSAIAGISVVTTPVLSRLVIISQDTRPASAEVPSRSSDSPTATPMTNSHAILSISAPPAFINRKPMLYSAPLVAAPGTPITPGAIA